MVPRQPETLPIAHLAPSLAPHDDPEAARAHRRWLAGRVLVYGLLALFGLVYAFPALIVLSNSFRSYPEVVRHGIIALPVVDGGGAVVGAVHLHDLMRAGAV